MSLDFWYGSASGAEMASREEALIVQTLRSEADYRSLISPTGACPGGMSLRGRRGQPLRYCPVTLAQFTPNPRLLPWLRGWAGCPRVSGFLGQRANRWSPAGHCLVVRQGSGLLLVSPPQPLFHLGWQRVEQVLLHHQAAALEQRALAQLHGQALQPVAPQLDLGQVG